MKTAGQNYRWLQQFKSIRYARRTHCLVCGRKLTGSLIRLPGLPLTEIFVKRQVTEHLGFADQFFHFCGYCGHGQLSRVLDQNVLYIGNYHFRTSQSSTAVSASNVFAAFIKKCIRNKYFGTIVDIGCNDLYLLRQLNGCGKRRIGVDPNCPQPSGESSGIEIVADFVENFNLKEAIKGGDSLIVCSHTLEHVPDPAVLLQRLFDAADHKTVFIFQFPCLECLVNDFRFDQIFHQHLNYFSLRSFSALLDGVGGEVTCWSINPHHWGTLLVAFRKRRSQKNRRRHIQGMKPAAISKNYTIFQKTMSLVAEKIHSLGREQVYGYGATLMLPILNYHLGGALTHLTGLLDDDRRKKGLYYLNLPLRIQWTGDIKDFASRSILLTPSGTITNIRAMLAKLRDLHPRQIIMPFQIF